MPKDKQSKNKAHFKEAADPVTDLEQPDRVRRKEDAVSVPGDNRIIMLQGSIDQDMAKMIVTKLIALGEKYENESAEDKAKNPIVLYIDSHGGHITAGMSIYDTMNHVQARYGLPIATIGLGANMSMASFLLCAGTPGYRSMMPNSDHMIHEPSRGGGGRATEHEVTNDYIQELKERMLALYVAHTKMTYKQARKLFDHTNDYLRAEECLKKGIVDFIQYPDSVVAMTKQRQTKENPATYAPGIEKHLARIAKKEREMNISHLSSRESKQRPGLYEHLNRH
jgi:ATP-dependent Clp protease protease subunit